MLSLVSAVPALNVARAGPVKAMASSEFCYGLPVRLAALPPSDSLGRTPAALALAHIPSCAPTSSAPLHRPRATPCPTPKPLAPTFFCDSARGPAARLVRTNKCLHPNLPRPPRQGNIAPAGNFDPANLLDGTSEEEVYRWREAELTHGRVGMLAAAGFLVQENFHPLFSGDGGPAIEQIPGLPPAIWFLMTLGIGVVETLRIQKGWANPYEGMDNVQRLKPGYEPGDLGFDPLGLMPDDPDELRTMQERELSHGRLAMLAAAGFLAQEGVSGKTWSQQDTGFEGLLLGGYFNQEAAELARDAATGL